MVHILVPNQRFVLLPNVCKIKYKNIFIPRLRSDKRQQTRHRKNGVRV